MTLIPDFMPVLSAGGHDSPADGACAMEMASILAGESFSDRPQCADENLAHLVRVVNDCVSDSARQKMLPFITRVIGTSLHDPAEDDRVWAALAEAFFEPRAALASAWPTSWRDCYFVPVSGVMDWVLYADGDPIVALTEVFDAFDELTGHKPQENVDLAALEQRRRELAGVA